MRACLSCCCLPIIPVSSLLFVCLWLVCDPTPLLAVVARHPAAAGCRQRTDELRRLGSFAGRARSSCFDEPLGETRWAPGWWAGCWGWQLLLGLPLAGPVHETTRVHDIVRETILPPQPLGRPPLLVPRPVLSSAMLGDRGGPTHWVDPRRSLYLESLSLARPKHRHDYRS